MESLSGRELLPLRNNEQIAHVLQGLEGVDAPIRQTGGGQARPRRCRTLPEKRKLVRMVLSVDGVRGGLENVGDDRDGEVAVASRLWASCCIMATMPATRGAVHALVPLSDFVCRCSSQVLVMLSPGAKI